jgi:predicted RNA-binding protein YlqC (UPF0109 family)
LKGLLNSILSQLCDKPFELTVEEGEEVVYRVKPDEADVGRLIGREGANIKAIRQIFRTISAHKEGKKVRVEVEGGKNERKNSYETGR